LDEALLHYEIQTKLDEDSSGETFLALDRRRSRSVRLKVLSATLSPTRKARFLQECRAIARLNHPNVSSLYEIDTVGDQVLIVTEYLNWRGLDELLRKRHFSNPEVVKVGKQITSALAGLHGMGIVMRALTPASILLDEGLGVKLYDPEVFSQVDLEIGRTLTQPMRSQESLSYAAPEVLAGKPQTTNSDLYALGVVLFQMATGKLPYQADDLTGLAESVFYDPVPNARAYNPELTPELSQVIDQLLQKDPALRIGTAESVLQRLDKMREGVGAVRGVSGGAPLSVRAWQATTEYARKASDRVLSMVGSAVGDLVMTYKSKPSVAQPEREPARRFVNTWFEGKGQIPPLEVNSWYSFHVNIGAARNERAGTSGVFSEPDFGDNKELKLLVSLFSTDFEIQKGGRGLELILPRQGDSRVLEVEVKPLHEGACRLEMVISLARELEVLQVLEAAVQAEVANISVSAGV
jgi:serine/threonine protein kinase